MKLFWLVVTPSTVLVSLVFAGAALLLSRWRKFGRGAVIAGALGLLLFGSGTLPELLMRSLEDQVSMFLESEAPPDGIIVLGGGVGRVRGKLVLYEPGRMIAAAQLAKRYPGARLVFSGGDASLLWSADTTEATAAKALFDAVGISTERVLIEDRSRNTRENALYSRALLGGDQRWVLVTSAFHMPRALGVFRSIGLNVEPHPTDYRTTGKNADLVPSFGRFPGSLRDTDLAAKEWLALVGYHLAGYTGQLLPTR